MLLCRCTSVSVALRIIDTQSRGAIHSQPIILASNYYSAGLSILHPPNGQRKTQLVESEQISFRAIVGQVMWAPRSDAPPRSVDAAAICLLGSSLSFIERWVGQGHCSLQ